MKRIMGLDYGDRRIGVAISDVFGWTAQGLEVIERRRDGGELDRIAELVKEHEVGEVVVGLPKNMNGTIGPRGEICMEFASTLRESLSLPVHLWMNGYQQYPPKGHCLKPMSAERSENRLWIKWRQA